MFDITCTVVLLAVCKQACFFYCSDVAFPTAATVSQLPLIAIFFYAQKELSTHDQYTTVATLELSDKTCSRCEYNFFHVDHWSAAIGAICTDHWRPRLSALFLGALRGTGCERMLQQIL